MTYQAMLSEKINRFDQEIDRFFLDTYPAKAQINDAMRYSLKAGGKRLRPLLFLAFNAVFDGSYEKALPFAMAIEMIHTYSLIHDDLPAMDNDDLRRGKPTNHIVFGEGLAILAGDGLLNLAFEVMADHVKTKQDLLAMRYITKASGTSGMILGQVADIQNENTAMDKETLDFINAHKTGKLLAASIVGGALLAGADPKTIAILEEAAYEIGLMFQMADDLLDLIGDPAKLGKQTQMDAKNNKTTYPMLMGKEATQSQIETYRQNTLKRFEALEIRDDFLIKTIDFLTQRDY